MLENALVCWCLQTWLSLEHYQYVNESGLIYWRIQDHISADSHPASRQLTVTSQPSTQSQKHACATAKISYLSLTQSWRSTLLKTAQIVGLHIFELNKWLLLGGKYKAKQKPLKMLACRGAQFVNSYKLCVCVYAHNSILSWLCTFIPLIPMPCCEAFSLFLVLWY